MNAPQTTTEPPVQVLNLLEGGHYQWAAELWSKQADIPLPSASMLCLGWLNAEAKKARA